MYSSVVSTDCLPLFLQTGWRSPSPAPSLIPVARKVKYVSVKKIKGEFRWWVVSSTIFVLSQAYRTTVDKLIVQLWTVTNESPRESIMTYNGSRISHCELLSTKQLFRKSNRTISLKITDVRLFHSNLHSNRPCKCFTVDSWNSANVNSNHPINRPKTFLTPLQNSRYTKHLSLKISVTVDKYMKWTPS